jgi:excisionase family DNA binding protein
MESTTAVAQAATITDKTREPKYSKEEAAKLIGVSPITVWREIKRGKLGCYRVCGGRVLLIGKSHIEKYLADSEQCISVGLDG